MNGGNEAIGVETELGEDVLRLALRDEAGGNAEHLDERGRREVVHAIGDHHTDASFANAVLDGHDAAVCGGVSDHRWVQWGTRPDIPHSNVDATRSQPLSGSFRRSDHLADREDADRLRWIGGCVELATEEASADLVLADLTRIATRIADHHRAFVG